MGAIMLRRDPHREDPTGEHVHPQLMGTKVMGGWLHIDAEGVASEEQLADIVERGVSYARSLPPK